MKIRVAIADDHTMVSNGLEKMLENTDVEVIASYPNGNMLLAGLRTSQPDVLLLDIQMPGQTGEELMPILYNDYPEIKVVVLTGFEEDYYMKTMFQAGALGYILKSSDKQTILNAIHEVYQNKEYIDPAIRDNTHAVLRAHKPHIQRLQLSPREKEVLKLTAEGLSSTEIAKKLFLGKRTIENYRMSLLLKLDAKNTAMLVTKAISLRLL